MKTTIDRYNYFDEIDPEGVRMCFAEHYPPGYLPKKGIDLTRGLAVRPYNTNMTEHPGIKPNEQNFCITFSDHIDNRDFSMKSWHLEEDGRLEYLDFGFNWGEQVRVPASWQGDFRSSANFRYFKGRGHLEISLLLYPSEFYEASIDNEPLPTDSYLAFKLCFGIADTSTLLNNHAPSTAITSDKLSQTDLWVHSNFYPDVVEFLNKDKKEECRGWWQTKTDLDLIVGMLEALHSSPGRSLEEAHRLASSLSKELDQLTAFLSKILTWLPLTEIYRAGKKCSDESHRLEIESRTIHD